MSFIICTLHQAVCGDMRNAYVSLIGKPEGKTPLGRTRCIWEDNIKKDLEELGCEGAVWIQLAQNKVQLWFVMNTVRNLRVP
jgi:hypothetical protein